MCEADGHRQRVGRIVRARQSRQAEHPLDHLLHLCLVGTAVAGDGDLHLVRAVLVHFETVLRRRQQDRAARLSHGEGGLHVLVEEEPLDGNEIRAVGLDEVGDGIADRDDLASLAIAIGLGAED